jgi:ankyrin repeat protein
LDLILRCGASVDQPDSNGKTSLHHACELGDLKAVGLLLRYLISKFVEMVLMFLNILTKDVIPFI